MTSEKSDPSCKLHAIFIELSICHVDVVRNQIIITGSITKMFPLQSCTYRSTATPNNETMIIKNGSTSQNHKRPCPLNIPLIIRTRTRTTWKRAQAETRDAPSSSGILLFQQQVIDSHLVFAYPFHFGKSGFSAYFSRHIRISGFYPDFFVQVRIGPYILFSSCKWHRRCRPTDENKNCSNVNTITWWCNVFQTSDSLKVNDEDSLKSSESEESLRSSDSED